MEPISELATRITSHLWLLHDLYPDEPSVTTVLSGNWRPDLEQRAVNDWSLLQLVLDLVCDSLDGESSEPQPERLSRQATRRNTGKATHSKVEQTATPHALASRALEKLARRMDTVRQEGLDADLTFAASCPAIAPQPSGEHPPSRLLTREELFQNVANWLLSREVPKLRVFADAFMGHARFLMEEEITRCAEAIKKTAGKHAGAEIDADWLRKSASAKRDLVLDRPALRAICKRFAVPVPFSIVLSDELDEIARSRLVRLYGYKPDPSSPPPAEEARTKCGVPVSLAISSQQAFRSSLFGMALSGGGIRSATFALGLLQGMADRNLLPYIDILSTVSGGGYIGSWLISWIKRRGGIENVQQSLRGSASPLKLGKDCPDRRPATAGPQLSKPLGWISRNSDPHSDHVRPVRLLRDYSRYLAPQGGFFSADSWTIAATWFRNTALNLLVLVLFFGAALLLPRLAIFVLQHLGNMADPNLTGLKLLLIILLAGVPLLAACVLIRVRNLNTFRDGNTPAKSKGRVSRGDNDTEVVFEILP
ncbi:MAG: patatin-like phospholipase family protein, partial [Acidobacteriaceae bacterium]|nr:patatin-like phospholipase family protein [Acidobacteriaceae bacterium]